MSRPRTIGLVLLSLISVLDILGLAGFFMGDAPPAWVMIVGAALGLITLAGVWLTFSGRPSGVAIAVASRVVAALLGVGAFLDQGAPGWSKVVVGIAIALTAFGVLLVVAGRHPAVATEK